jgi:hypothetical protein
VRTQSYPESSDEISGSEMHDVVSTTLGAGAVRVVMQVGAGGRDVVETHLNRGEVGSFLVYEANWHGSGGFKYQAKRDMETDWIANGQFQVITAQEADPDFVAKLTSSDVGGGWLLVTGNEPGNTLLIGARASLVKEVKMLEWHRLVDGEYRVKPKQQKAFQVKAYSRVMLAEVVWNHSMAGQESHLFLTCHMHRHTSRKAKHFAAGFDRFWNTVGDILQRHDVDFITGDFNKSLWQVCPQLRIQHPATTVLAWYGWKVTARVWHRSTTCGIFSLRKPERVKRIMPDDAFEGLCADLDEWKNREGIDIDNFMGGRDAVKLSLEDAPSGDAGMFTTKEKEINRGTADTGGFLFAMGIHTPLLVYVGSWPTLSNSSSGSSNFWAPMRPEG